MSITNEINEVQANSFTRPLTNREMASILFNIATVLRREGNVNPFRTAAYERGARALMGYGEEVGDVLREGAAQVPFRPWQHIGKKLQAKMREMAETGALDQYADLLAVLPAHQRSLMTIPGIGPKTADAVYETLGITTAADLVRAARDGRLRRVKGFGEKRTSSVAALPLPEGAAGETQLRLFEIPLPSA